ncbi:hypothetical protein ACP70R_045410 [Stipagrostis hirtigluma subsp. patula]
MAAAAARHASSGLTALSHRLTKHFSAANRCPANAQRGSGNLVFSPLSIYSVLSLAAAGAGGRTLAELLGLLGAGCRGTLADNVRAIVEHALPADPPQPGGPRVAYSCALWHDAARTLRPAYRAAAAATCRAVARAVDFRNEPEEARQQINAWVAAATRNLINSILPRGSVDSSTRLVLTNAVYFKGRWERPFATWRTKVHKFHRLDGGGAIDAKFMSCVKDQFVAVHDGFKVLKMPYTVPDEAMSVTARTKPLPRPPRYSMCVFLPDAHDGLWSLEESMASDPGFLFEHLPDQRVMVGEFRVPKFKLSFSRSIKNTLHDLGIKDLFSRGADLKDMLEDDGSGEPLFASDVFHRAVIEVNEEGTEAAAATAMTMHGSCPPLEPPPNRVNFVADHPFAFYVVEELSGAILFGGHVLDPTESME